MGGWWGGDGPLAWAVLTTVAEVGLERATVEAIAGRLDRSRASLHRVHGTLGVMLETAYWWQVEHLGGEAEGLQVGTPRQQVEDLFERVRGGLRTKEGVGLRAVRRAIAARSDLEDFRRREVEVLGAVRGWLGTLVDPATSRQPVVDELTALFWSLCIGRGSPGRDPGPVTEAELALAWELIGPFVEVGFSAGAPVSLDDVTITALGEPLGLDSPMPPAEAWPLAS